MDNKEYITTKLCFGGQDQKQVQDSNKEVITQLPDWDLLPPQGLVRRQKHE